MSIINRGTGLLVIEVRHSNPNGDPDTESDPRTLDIDQRGLISPVSFKRKLRDLVADKEGPAWSAAAAALPLGTDPARFGILEMRDRDRQSIAKLSKEAFVSTYWDARVFGNTFLEKKMDDFIAPGVVQFGPGISVAPIEIERMTNTNKAGVQEGKDRGMAPLGWRVVRHGVYTMPFFVNPMAARQSGCTAIDLDLMKFLIPHAYRGTASAMRPFVEIRHAWFAGHKGPLGSCPDSLIVDALSPKKVRGEPDEPSTSIDDYEIPADLPPDIRSRLASFEDLCARTWS